MALSIRAQALSILLALGTGAGLGLLYDLLRPVRRRGRGAVWDALFCAAAAALCFLLALREETGRLAGGQLLGRGADRKVRARVRRADGRLRLHARKRSR